MRYLVLLLLLGACDLRPVVCQTRCGMQLVGPIPARNDGDGGYSGVPWWTCENFQKFEDDAFDIWQRDVVDHDPRFNRDNACQALNEYQVAVMPEESWVDPSDGPVYGLTECWARDIQVNDVPPYAGSLLHEMSHAVQQCDPLPPIPPCDGGADCIQAQYHANWIPDGIYLSVDDMYTYIYLEQWNVCHLGLPPADGGTVDADFCN